MSNKTYELQLPASLRKIINNPKTEAEKNIINSLPPQILEAAKKFNKPVSLMVHDADQQNLFASKGVRTFIHSVDTHKLSIYFKNILNQSL